MRARLWCVSSAPFGLPVVPEVKSSIAVSSGAASASTSSSGGSPAGNAPTVTRTHVPPVASAAASACSCIPSSAKISFAPDSESRNATSRFLLSTFIGSTIAPYRSAP